MTLTDTDFLASITENKLEFYRKCSSILPLVPYTEDSLVAKDWLNEGEDVCYYPDATYLPNKFFVYTSVEEGLNLPKKGLYTKYVPKSDEYVFTVNEGKIENFYKKVLSTNKNRHKYFHVRTPKNGWVLTEINEKDLPEIVLTLVKETISVTGLVEGSIDIIYNIYRSTSYVLGIHKKLLKKLTDECGIVIPKKPVPHVVWEAGFQDDPPMYQLDQIDEDD
jgi:hypothetical protein